MLEGTSKVISDVRKSSDFTAIQKGTLMLSSSLSGKAASDVFTEADVLIQKTIEYNLRQLYPRATIIGTLFYLKVLLGEEDDEDQSFPFDKPYI